MFRKDSFENRLQRQRFSNSHGEVIPLHHAFKKIRFGGGSKLTVFGLPILFIALVWLNFYNITIVWNQIFHFWLNAIGMTDRVSYRPVELVWQTFNMPFPDLGTLLPDSDRVWTHLAITVILFIISLFFPAGLMPITYLFRGALLIHLSACIFFILSPYWFPYEFGAYLVDALSLGICLIFLAPIVLGLIYYIFDFPLWQKIMVTLLILGYFVLAIPHLYLLHAYIIHHFTLLLLPLMYFLFGVLVMVLMFVSLYAYGMSVGISKHSDLGRYA